MLLAQAETYLLLTKTAGWDIPTYRKWLQTIWRRLIHSSTVATPSLQMIEGVGPRK